MKAQPPLPPGYARWVPISSNQHRRKYFWIYRTTRGWSHPERGIPQFIVGGQAVDVFIAEPSNAVKFVARASLILTLLTILVGVIAASLLAFHAAQSITRYLLQ